MKTIKTYGLTSLKKFIARLQERNTKFSDAEYKNLLHNFRALARADAKAAAFRASHNKSGKPKCEGKTSSSSTSTLASSSAACTPQTKKAPAPLRQPQAKKMPVRIQPKAMPKRKVKVKPGEVRIVRNLISILLRNSMRREPSNIRDS